MENKKCELYDRDCIDCGECMFCDLDQTKICDNCGKCLNFDDDYAIKIESVNGVELKDKKRKNVMPKFSSKFFRPNKNLKKGE